MLCVFPWRVRVRQPEGERHCRYHGWRGIHVGMVRACGANAVREDAGPQIAKDFQQADRSEVFYVVEFGGFG